LNGINRGLGFIVGVAAITLFFRLLLTGYFDELKAYTVVSLTDTTSTRYASAAGTSDVQLVIELVFEVAIAIGTGLILSIKGVFNAIVLILRFLIEFSVTALRFMRGRADAPALIPEAIGSQTRLLTEQAALLQTLLIHVKGHRDRLSSIEKRLKAVSQQVDLHLPKVPAGGGQYGG
jgi:hypothetical protein